MSRLTHRIFVYGTLKRGQPNYFRLQDPAKYGVGKFLGEAKLTKRYPLVVATKYNIPLLLDKEGSGKEIQGEVFEVDDKLLEHLDWLESHPHTYTRTPTQCIMQDTQSTLDCEVYIVFNFNPLLLDLPHFASYHDGLDEGSKYKCRSDREEDGFSLAKEIKLQTED